VYQAVFGCCICGSQHKKEYKKLGNLPIAPPPIGWYSVDNEASPATRKAGRSWVAHNSERKNKNENRRYQERD
jgi:hypothetical protein